MRWTIRFDSTFKSIGCTEHKCRKVSRIKVAQDIIETVILTIFYIAQTIKKKQLQTLRVRITKLNMPTYRMNCIITASLFSYVPSEKITFEPQAHSP